MALSLQDKYDIIELAARYCFAVDFHEGDAAKEIFTEDGAFEWYELVGGKEILRVSAKGTEELKAFLNGTRALSGTAEATVSPTGGIRTGRHVTSNHVVEGDGDEATHRCYLGQNGVYNDEVVRSDGAWRIRTRKVVTGYA